jgi:hypothetical protein
MLNCSGFCYEKFTWLSNRDYIHLAVEERFARYGQLRQEYGSVENFLSMHPDCCRIDYSSAFIEHFFINMLLFRYRVHVIVNYPIEFQDQREIYTAYILVTNCGQASFDLGMGRPVSSDEDL